MAPPVHQEIWIIPVNTAEEDDPEVEEEENDLVCKRKRSNFVESTVRPQEQIEVPPMEIVKEEPGAPSLEVAASKEPIDGVTDYVEMSSGEANGCSKKRVRGNTCTEPARLTLQKNCCANRWKAPKYDFEEQGPPHNRLFTCKVTVHVETITDTVLECTGDPKLQKKAAQEHAAQGALWYLKRFGYAS